MGRMAAAVREEDPITKILRVPIMKVLFSLRNIEPSERQGTARVKHWPSYKARQDGNLV